MSEILLDARQLEKSYGRITVLRGVSLTIGEGESHVVIGPNGAGKTTLFKVLTGELLADQGQVHFRGEDISALPAHQRVQRGFGRTFQVARVFGKLTVQDNLNVALEAHARSPRAGTGMRISERLQALLSDIGLSAHRNAVAGSLAYGDRKRLEMAMVLALEPVALFLDEPTAGMSTAERHATVQLLRHIKKTRGLSLLMTEHDMDVVFGLADRISVLHYGQLIASGSPEAIRNDQRVKDIYLGDGDAHA